MRLCRFNENGLGLVRDDRVIDVTPVLDHLPSHRYPLPRFDPLIAGIATLREAIEREAKGKSGVPCRDVALTSPIANPGKIVAAPVNYKKHLDEAREDPEIHHQNQIAEIQRVGLFQGIQLRYRDFGSNRDPTRGSPHRSRNRAGGGDWPNGRSRPATSSARFRGRLLHWSRHHRPRT
jgi:hypothetical protein